MQVARCCWLPCCLTFHLVCGSALTQRRPCGCVIIAVKTTLASYCGVMLSMAGRVGTATLAGQCASAANKIKASPEETPPAELVEDPKFVPLNPDDPTFGPPALLLVGFQVDEAVKIQKFLKELDGEFLEVIFCTEDMMAGSLWEAINTKQPNLQASKIAGSLPRICFLSGLTGEEMMMFIDAFPESGLEGAVFAAVVPNSADKPLQEVIEEIMGDHEMMKSRESS